MELKANLQKFMKHLKSAGLSYAIWRGIKYFVFLRREGKNIIKKGRITLVCERHAVKLFWDSYEITPDVGFNVGINTLGMWTDSSKAGWRIEEKGVDYFKIKIVFKELPLRQTWTIRMQGERRIYWKVETEIEEWLHVDEFRILLMVHPRYKSWIHNHFHTDFTCLNSDWADLCIDSYPTSLVGVRFFTEGEFLPSIVIEPDSDKKDFLSIVQNTPLAHNAHIIGVKEIIPGDKRDFSPGSYSSFSGAISIYEEDSLLDEKVERLRQDYLDARVTGGIREYEVKT